MKKITFNTTHPELRNGEMFITNCINIDDFFDNDNYHSIQYKSKRRGEIAYTIHGEPMENAYPVFIQIKEYEDKYND